MKKLNSEARGPDTIRQETAPTPEPVPKAIWETPKMEDVSQEVMAQPYIRFT
jgi:hypothetical protein